MADCIQIFVSNGEALVETVEAMKGSLSKRHLIINNCTADPDSVVEAYEIANEADATFLDAPFTGSREAAGKGALVYYVGGDPAALDLARPILEASSKEILYVGRVGEATVLKLATNMISASTVEVLSEALGLVTAAGIEPTKLGEAISLNACGSPLTEMKLPTMIEENYETHFSLKHMFKDAQYALSLGKRLGIEMPTMSTTASVMFRTMQKGHGEADYSVLAAKYQEKPEGNPATSSK